MSTTGRGLRISGTNFVFLDEGAYGYVFVDHAARRVIKIYKSSHSRDHCEEVFCSETEAYQIAGSKEELRVLVPDFFGTGDVLQIIDQNGDDASDKVYPDLSFVAEFVEGIFEKIGNIGGEEMKRIKSLFSQNGIYHTIDASVIFDGSQIIKVIDFAIRDVVLQHEHYY